MASSKEYLEFILDGCSGLSARAMMGEYVLSKAGVIEFFASDKAFRIYNKSKWHEQAVKRLIKSHNLL